MLSQITVRAMTERDRNYGLEIQAAPGEARILIGDLHHGLVYEASCPIDEQDMLVDSVFNKLNPQPTGLSRLGSGTFVVASGGGYARAAGKTAQAQGLNGGRATAEGNASSSLADGPAESIATGLYAQAEARARLLTGSPKWPSGDYRVHAKASGDGAMAAALLDGGDGAEADADGARANSSSHATGTGSSANSRARAGLHGYASAESGANVVAFALQGDVSLTGQQARTAVYVVGGRPEAITATFDDGQLHFMNATTHAWDMYKQG